MFINIVQCNKDKPQNGEYPYRPLKFIYFLIYVQIIELSEEVFIINAAYCQQGKHINKSNNLCSI